MNATSTSDTSCVGEETVRWHFVPTLSLEANVVVRLQLVVAVGVIARDVMDNEVSSDRLLAGRTGSCCSERRSYTSWLSKAAGIDLERRSRDVDGCGVVSDMFCTFVLTQSSHVRTLLLWNRMRLVEQVRHTISPQRRQWCLPAQRRKLRRQLEHVERDDLGTQCERWHNAAASIPMACADMRQNNLPDV